MEFETEKSQKIFRRSLDQFRYKPKIQALMNSYGIEYQEVENVFASLIVLRDVDTVLGDALYKLGDMLGEPYKGQSVEEYRLAIKTRVFANSLHSRAEEILTLFINHHMVDRKMKFSLRSEIAQTYESAYTAWVYLQRIKGGAHKADYQYAEVSNEEHYQLDVNSKGSLFDTETYTSPESNNYCNAIRINNLVWFIPKAGNYWTSVNVLTNEVNNYTKSFSGSMAYGVYDGNSNIWTVPDNVSTVVKFNIITQVETSYSISVTPEENMFSYAVIDSSNSYLVGIPYNSEAFLRIDLADGSNTTVSYTGGVSCARCKHAVVDGDYIYTAPYNAATIARYKPSDNTISTYAHLETGSALWQKAIVHDGYVWFSPYTSGQFMRVLISSMAVTKLAWEGQQFGDFLCDAFLVGNNIIHVPGKHDYWINLDTQNFVVVNKTRHTLPTDTICAQRAVQHNDLSITGYGSLDDQYIIKFDPRNNRSYRTKTPFQSEGVLLYTPACLGDRDDIFWASENENNITKINWLGAFKTKLTKIVRLIENVWDDGDCEASDISAWSGVGIFQKNTNIKHSGEQSLHVQSLPTFAYILNTGRMIVGNEYEFIFWFYTEEIADIEYVDIRSGSTTIYRTSIKPLMWNKISYYFVAVDDEIDIYVKGIGTFEFFIDDCRLTRR